jgi:hypothetical protein
VSAQKCLDLQKSPLGSANMVANTEKEKKKEKIK